jgi:Sortase domain
MHRGDSFLSKRRTQRTAWYRPRRHAATMAQDVAVVQPTVAPTRQTSHKPRRAGRKAAHATSYAVPKVQRSRVLNRQTIHERLQEFIETPLQLRSKKTVVAALVVIGLIIVSASYWIVTRRSQQLAERVSGSAEVVLKDGEVSEDTVTVNDVARFQTGPTMPRRITIPRIGVETLIRPVMTNDAGLPKNPRNINEVAWMSTSDPLGQNGVTVLVGYMRGPTQKGVFHDLDSLVPSDSIKMMQGDSKIFYYRVVSVQAFEKGTISPQNVMFSPESGKSVLNLVTIIHPVGVAIDLYTKQYLVSAVLDE